MTTGALLFAYNNDTIDYVSMAKWTAKNIHRHLDIPVALVTDVMPTSHEFDKVILVQSTSENTRYFSDYAEHVVWHNTNRSNAYELSPWDQTLVLDVDYVVAGNSLCTVLNDSHNFLAHRWAYDITGINDFSGLNYFGNYNMPMWWATVMMFKRDKTTQMIFDTMNMIRDNWPHYRNLYANPRYTYRNDHALSIALNIIDGHTLNHPGILWKLASLTPEHNLTEIAQDQYRVDFVTPDKKSRWITIKNQDFHAMGKKQLGEIIVNAH